MTLPSVLQPAWPLLKRAHRASARGIGALGRAGHGLAGDRALPTRVASTVEQTAAYEPGAVTVHPGGPSEVVHRPPPAGSPANHWRFAAQDGYVVPRRFVLEVAGGRLVGEKFASTVTPGGTLDLETSGYFGTTSWRENPVHLKLRLPPVEHVSGDLLVLHTRGGAANFYHYVLDVVTRWGVYQEAMPGARPDAVLVADRSGYQRQLLDLLGIGDLPRIAPSSRATRQADRLLVPAMPNPDLVAPTWTVEWLRSQVRPSGARDTPRRVYVTRGRAPNTRRLVDEEALLPDLERRGFVRVDPGTLGVQEQVDVFAGAEAVVAPHGAGLTNLVFARPDVRVLELFAPSYVNVCYWQIASAIGAGPGYRYLVAEVPARAATRGVRPGAAMQGVLADITLDRRRLLDAVDDLLA